MVMVSLLVACLGKSFFSLSNNVESKVVVVCPLLVKGDEKEKGASSVVITLR